MTSMCHLFLQCQWSEIEPWKSNVKVIDQGHIVGPTSYWLTSLLFHVNRPTVLDIYGISKIWPWKYKVKVVMGEFKVTKWVRVLFNSRSFLSMSIGSAISEKKLFQNFNSKKRLKSWVRKIVKVTQLAQHPFHVLLLFQNNRPTHSYDMTNCMRNHKRVWTNIHLIKKQIKQTNKTADWL